MELSAKILIVGGIVSLTYGFALGLPLTNIRMQSPVAPRHLVTAHLAAIMQGTMLLALAGVIGFAELPSWLITAAALLLCGGCILFVAGAVANWRQNVVDHFAERSLGWKLLATSGPMNLIAIITLLIGLVRGVVVA